MRRLLVLAALVAAAHAAPHTAHAQQSAPAVAARTIVVPEGTERSAVTTTALSSRTAAEGDRVSLRFEEDVRVDGVVVIARGAMVRGTVSEARAAGRMGRGGTKSVTVP